MRGENDFRALFDGLGNRRQRAANARVVLDATVFADWHVEIYADENSFAPDVDVSDCLLVHNWEILTRKKR